MKRPSIDVLASLSGNFRHSFANVVDQLDDMFERCAVADRLEKMNFVKKHANETSSKAMGLKGLLLVYSQICLVIMVQWWNEVGSSFDKNNEESLLETWQSRNVVCYGKNDVDGGSLSGSEHPKVS